MNKKILISFLFLFFAINSVNASFLWDINYGIELVQQKKYKQANDYFKNYVKSNPNDEEGYFWLGKINSILKDENRAILAYKKAYELGSKDKNIDKIDFEIKDFSNLEDYFNMASTYYETGFLEQANAYADMILRINPKSASAYFLKAKIAKTQGKTNEAKEYLNKGIILDNSLIKTKLAKSLKITRVPSMSLEDYESFAIELYYTSQTDSAIRYCKKYLSINNENIDMVNMLIDLYIKNNEIIQAQSLIDEILDKNANIQTFLHQAKIYELENNSKIEQILLRAYQINPNHQKVLLSLGNYYLKKQDFLKSKKYFEILVSVNDALYEGYFGYIYSLIQLGEIEESMNLIRKLTSLNSFKSGEIEYLLAKLCSIQGEYNEAIDYLNQAIEYAKNPIYFYERAKVAFLLKEYEEAIDDFAMALELQNSIDLTDEINNYIVFSYLKLKDKINAQKYLNTKALDKNRIIYKYYLYIIYKLQGIEKISADYLKQIKKAKPSALQDYIDLSEIYLDKTNYIQSIKILEKGIKKYPNSYELYFQKAKIYTLLSKQNSAKQTFNQYKKNNN